MVTVFSIVLTIVFEALKVEKVHTNSMQEKELGLKNSLLFSKIFLKHRTVLMKSIVHT